MRMPWMCRALWLVGGVLAVAACDQSLTPPDGPSLSEVPCDELPGPLDDCEEEASGGALNVFDYWWLGGNRHDLSLYEPSPSPDYPGINLGPSVTPSACFNNPNPPGGDAEGDGLADACEFALARAFAPYMQFGHGEALVGFPDGTNRHCAEGEPYWAAKLFDTYRVVNIVYMMGYYVDCGEAVVPNVDAGVTIPLPGFELNLDVEFPDSHKGDSELIRLSVAYNSATRHWELRQAFLSAHYKSPSNLGSSVYAAPDELTYPKRDRAFPQTWVSRNKHANYKSYRECEGGGFANLDSCDEDLWHLRARFPVRQDRNVQRATCVYSLFISNSPRCEYFAGVPRPFSGWLILYPTVGVNNATKTLGVTPYQTLLSSGYVYENLHPAARVYPLSVSLSGPSSVEVVGGYAFPSPRFDAEVRGGLEAGTVYRWTDNGVVKPSTSNMYWMSPVTVGTHVITVRVTHGNEVRTASKTVVVGQGGDGDGDGGDCPPLGCWSAPM